MEQKHVYTSNLTYGSIKYNLNNLKESFLNYFTEDSTPVFYYTANIHDLWGFNKDGISVHMQTTKIRNTELHFIDLKLISEKTPTLDLEERLNQIAENNRNKI